MSTTLSSIGTRCDIELVRGCAFAKTITYKSNGTTTNISGYTFAAQIRDETGTLATAITCTITDAANGVFTIALTQATTATLTVGRPYVWDLLVSVSGVTMPLLRGFVTVAEQITQ